MNKRLVIALILVGIVGGLAWFFGYGSHHLTTNPPVAYGNVDIRESNLSFRVSGQIAEILVEEGDSVVSGQLLARLDPEPYRRSLERARAEARQAQAILKRLTNGYRVEDIREARAKLRRAKATRLRAEQDLKRQQQLIQTDATTQEALDRAEALAAKSKAAVQASRARVDRLQKGFRQEKIDQARAALEAAQARFEELKLKLDDCKLRAPESGTILTRVSEAGAVVAAGQRVLTLTLTNRTWVRAYISEPRLGHIHPGMPVAVKTDSRDQTYHGQIGFIAPRAEFTPKNVETPELRTDLVYRFRVIVEDADEGLRQGMPVTVMFDSTDKASAAN